MPRAYSPDMRTRVITQVKSGASRREAAEHYDQHGGDLGKVLPRGRLLCRQAAGHSVAYNVESVRISV
jgi:hypothetical protein